MVQNQIIPAAVQYQKVLADSFRSTKDVIGDDRSLKLQKELVRTVSTLIAETQKLLDDLGSKIRKANAIGSGEKKAAFFCSEVKKTMLELRDRVDSLEHYVDNELWPVPKYWEMLFIC